MIVVSSGISALNVRRASWRMGGFRRALLPWPDCSGRTSSATDECAAGFQRIGFSTATSLGVERLDQTQHASPGHDLIHLGKEAFAACLLAFVGVFEIGKAHLAHGRLGSGDQAYFSIFEHLFGYSLNGEAFHRSLYIATRADEREFRAAGVEAMVYVAILRDVSARLEVLFRLG